MAPIDAGHIVGRLGHGDGAVAAIAARQHGLILSRQLQLAGVSNDAARHRAKRGSLHRVHTGVYRVGHASPSLLSDLLAAVMSAGPTAALSHLAAARLWDLVRDHGATIDVTARANRRNRPGIRTHRSATLEPSDLAEINAIPVTSPALTLLDLAGTGSAATAEAALDEARFKRHSTDHDLRQLRRRHPRRRGWGLLGSILDSEREPGFSRSDAERLLLGVIREAGLPEPLRNHRIHSCELDLYWPEHGLAVEVDGYASHGRRGNFERDRARDADLDANGIKVRRFTWHQITRRRLWVAARLGAAITRGA